MDLTRRGFLAAALGVALSGCVPAPETGMDASTSPWPRSSAWGQAASAELALAGAYAAAAPLVAGASGWCQAAATAHAAHAGVLTRPDPFSYAPGTPAPPVVTFADAAGAVGGVRTAAAAVQAAAKAGFAEATAQSSSPSPSLSPSLSSSPGVTAVSAPALLWASLAVWGACDAAWCDAAAQGWQPATRGDVAPSLATTLPSLAAAAQNALSQVDELAWCLQTGLGITDARGQLHADLAARLQTVQGMAGALQATIRAGGRSPAPPQLSYALPGKLDSDDDIRATWTALEGQVGLSYIQVCAGQSGDDAATSADVAGQLTAQGMPTGIQLTWWPGWQ